MRVADALLAYSEQRLAHQRRGRATYRSLRVLLGPVGGRDIRDISAAVFDELIQKMGANAPVHASRAQAYAAPFFRWATQTDLIDEQPLAQLAPPRPQPRRERVLGLAEIRFIWSAAGALGHPFGPAIRLLMLTAAYREDVAAMRISELSGGPGSDWSWRPSARAREKGDVEIPLPGPAVGLIQDRLEARKPGSDFVFSTTGETPISGWSRAKRRLDVIVHARAKGPAPMAPWRLNDLRASFAALSREILATDPLVVERCLGRVSGYTSPLEKEWAASQGMRREHRLALARWADLVTSD